MKVALAGSPNCGKTALFNAITGGRQKVGNYAGVTVERKEGTVITPSGLKVDLLDLPGTYSLDAKTPDEIITRDVLLGAHADEKVPRVLVAVADATNLERSLSLVLELRALGKPVVLALNMMDLARQRGLEFDLQALSRELGVAVVPTVAVRREGIQELLSHLESALNIETRQVEAMEWKRPTLEEVRSRFSEVDRILKAATRSAGHPNVWTDRIDRVVVHPFWGTLLLGVILAVVFQAVFTWAAPFQDWIEAAVGVVGQVMVAIMPAGVLRDLLVEGVIAGVGGVLVFLPQIVLLFVFILILEDSGYMARAAFLMDRVMGKVGLHGRAFIPLLSSFACAIPGIMATRTIENRRDRLITILIAPLMACSARLPVYALLIAAFIPNIVVWGPFRAQGLVMLGLYLAGVIAALAVALVFKLTLFRGPKPIFLLELPTYKWPSFQNIMLGLKERAGVFIRRAGTVILSLTILLWFMASYPGAPENATEPAIHYSYAGQLGKAVEPVLQPIGFDWRIGVALIPGFAAREVMVSALATVYAVEAADEESAAVALEEILARGWTLATALSLLMWYVLAPQCLSTLAVVRRESNSWRWPIFMLIYLTGLAYLGSYFVYNVAVSLGWG